MNNLSPSIASNSSLAVTDLWVGEVDFLQAHYLSTQLVQVPVKTTQGIIRQVELTQNSFLQLTQFYQLTQSCRENETAYVLFDTTYTTNTNWQLLTTTHSLEVINTLIQSAVNPADLLVLFKLIEGITNPAFRNFLWEVLGNPEIGVPFVSSPASLYHHHHLPGDLLAHSLECAHIASGAMEAMLLPTNEREVTLIAALLHDIGKVRTFDAEGKRTLTGVFIDHNDLTLRVLDSELRKLESNYENGAVTLAYLLSWRFERERIPKFPTASLVWVCDCLSASLNLRKMGFENKPDYFHYTELKIGENRLWLNRLN